MKKERRREAPLTVRYPHSAGIDVGKKELYVAVAEEAAETNVRTFGIYAEVLKSWRVGCATVACNKWRWKPRKSIGS